MARINPHMNQKDYTWYVVNKRTMKIESGWEFKNDASEHLDDLSFDVSPEGINKGDAYRVHSKSFLIGKGVDPYIDSNWEGHEPVPPRIFKYELTERKRSTRKNPLSFKSKNYSKNAEDDNEPIFSGHGVLAVTTVLPKPRKKGFARVAFFAPCDKNSRSIQEAKDVIDERIAEVMGSGSYVTLVIDGEVRLSDFGQHWIDSGEEYVEELSPVVDL